MTMVKGFQEISCDELMDKGGGSGSREGSRSRRRSVGDGLSEAGRRAKTVGEVLVQNGVKKPGMVVKAVGAGMMAVGAAVTRANAPR